jgi:carbon-monoxide dehydrogenase large subunit
MLRTIAADTLDADQAEIAVQWGSTVGAPPSGGTAGSRSTVLLGNAVGDACRTLRARLQDHDGHEPILVEGSFSGTPTNAIGMHAALVRVDADTLEPTVERLAVCYDAGHAVDPQSVRGQLVGATVQALGAALYEELRYDDAGELLTASLMDYLMPTHAEAPDVEAIIYETADPGNPLGARGAGEAGVFGVAAAVGSAVAQALGRSEAGVTSYPIAPRSLRSEHPGGLTAS